MGPLDGVKVLEWGDVVTAPYCGKLLADLGAEVIKIELPGHGDKSRSIGPFFKDIPGLNRSGLFLYLNTNKLGVTLDPSTESGREIFLDLISKTDVVLENQPVDYRDSIGLSYDTLRKTNPGVILVSISPFGETGPYRNYQATDFIISQMGGPGYLQPGREEASVDHPPVRPGGRQGDFSTALAAAGSVMHGLFQRQKTSEGCHIDVSALDSVASGSNTLVGPFFGNGTVIRRESPNATGPVPLLRENKVPCQDGYLVLQPRSYEDWQALAEIMGNPEWAQGEQFRDGALRAEYVLGKRPELWDWTRTQEKQSLYHAAQRRRIVSFPINNAEDLFNSEHLRAREYFVEVDSPETGPLKYPGAPAKFSKTPWSIRRAAPSLGEHNHMIFCETLGLTPDHLITLEEAGVV